MTKYVYEIWYDEQAITSKVNVMAERGWRLFQILPGTTRTEWTLVFERPADRDSEQ